MGILFTSDDGGLLHFILISVMIGGVLAWQAGRAIAGTWRSFWIVPVYMVILAAVVRFLHYALGAEALLDVQFYVVSFIICMAAAGYGYRSRRAEQMGTQYSWIYQKSGPVGWAARN
jgi:hypothetical protein